jgi:Golgi SNAP receptor complex protein 1
LLFPKIIEIDLDFVDGFLSFRIHQIESKWILLILFNINSQLVQSIPDATTNDLFLAESGMGSPTVASTAEDEAALRHDIQRTLTTLQDLVTTQLQPKAEKLGKSLLVKRYREILFDLSGDFEKSRQAHTRKVERSKLMEGHKQSSSLNIDQNGMDHLMRERNHIHNSQSAASNVIAQATEIRNEIRSQGMSLGRAQNLMGQIATNIPGINVIVEKIKKKKTKDDMIVIGVISSCIVFTLYYLFG